MLKVIGLGCLAVGGAVYGVLYVYSTDKRCNKKTRAKQAGSIMCDIGKTQGKNMSKRVRKWVSKLTNKDQVSN